MVILGIDPGIASTGYGVIRVGNTGGLHSIDYGTVTTSVKKPLEERLKLIYDGITGVINTFRPDEAAIETAKRRFVRSPGDRNHPVAISRHGVRRGGRNMSALPKGMRRNVYTRTSESQSFRYDKPCIGCGPDTSLHRSVRTRCH